MSEDPPVVLVVEDEPDLADLYAAWLGDDYDVRTAYGGHEALEGLDEDVNIVLLDRRMPGLSGYEIVERFRERGTDARIALVTATEPDFDALDVEFDEYVVKPVSMETLQDVVADLASRIKYDDPVQKYFALASKIATLGANKTDEELGHNERYEELQRDLASLEAEIGEQIAELDADQTDIGRSN